MSKHAEAVHEAQTHWEGGLTDGRGSITGSSSGKLAEVAHDVERADRW